MKARRLAWKCRLGTQLLLVAALYGACTPIPQRSPSDDALPSAPLEGTPGPPSASAGGGLFDYYSEARRLDIGERAPDTRLRDRGDHALTLSSYRGRVVVLSFIGTSEGNENDAEMLRRLAELGNALGPDLVDKVHLLTLVLDDASGSPAASRARAAAPAVDVPWTFVRATPADAARLAASFGVVVWQYADGSIGHSFNTVIIDPAGRFVDQFPGLDPWSPRDVAAAAGLAAHR